MKKTIAWILILVMMGALLTGCRAKKAEKTDHESQAASGLQQTENVEIQEEETFNLNDILNFDGEIILPEDELMEEAVDMKPQETEAYVETEESSKPTESSEPSQPVETSATEAVSKENGSSGSNSSIELPEDEF